MPTRDPEKIKARNERRRAYHRERIRILRAKDPERFRAYNRQYAILNRDKRREYDRVRRPHRHFTNREWCRRLRGDMIAAYGGLCECCGEAEPAFLTIEHKRRDGMAHRRALGGPRNVWRDLKKRGWPRDNYALMCMNCNWGRRITGVCPHDRQRAHLRLVGCRS